MDKMEHDDLSKTIKKFFDDDDDLQNAIDEIILDVINGTFQVDELDSVLFNQYMQNDTDGHKKTKAKVEEECVPRLVQSLWNNFTTPKSSLRTTYQQLFAKFLRYSIVEREKMLQQVFEMLDRFTKQNFLDLLPSRDVPHYTACLVLLLLVIAENFKFMLKRSIRNKLLLCFQWVIDHKLSPYYQKLVSNQAVLWAILGIEHIVVHYNIVDTDWQEMLQKLEKLQNNPVLITEAANVPSNFDENEFRFCAVWIVNNISNTIQFENLKKSNDRMLVRSAHQHEPQSIVWSEFKIESDVYYYEVTLHTEGEMRFGWKAMQDNVFIAFDGYNNCVWQNNTKFAIENNIFRWKSGDIVSCVINIEAESYDFYLNGKQIIVALFPPEQPLKMPFKNSHQAMAILSFDQQCYANLGNTTFVYLKQVQQQNPDVKLERVPFKFESKDGKTWKKINWGSILMMMEEPKKMNTVQMPAITSDFNFITSIDFQSFFNEIYFFEKTFTQQLLQHKNTLPCIELTNELLATIHQTVRKSSEERFSEHGIEILSLLLLNVNRLIILNENDPKVIHCFNLLMDITDYAHNLQQILAAVMVLGALTDRIVTLDEAVKIRLNEQLHELKNYAESNGKLWCVKEAHPIRNKSVSTNNINVWKSQIALYAGYYLKRLQSHPNTSRSSIKLSSDFFSVAYETDGLNYDLNYFETRTVNSNYVVQSGIFYHEVIPLTSGPIRIGWITNKSKANNLGDDKFSLGLDLYNSCIWYNGKMNPIVPSIEWEVGCVVGVQIDLTQYCKFDFFINGQPIPFEIIDMLSTDMNNDQIPTKDCIVTQASFKAAFTLSPYQQCAFNFGQAYFRYAPKNIEFQTFHSVTNEYRAKYQLICFFDKVANNPYIPVPHPNQKAFDTMVEELACKLNNDLYRKDEFHQKLRFYLNRKNHFIRGVEIVQICDSVIRVLKENLQPNKTIMFVNAMASLFRQQNKSDEEKNSLSHYELIDNFVSDFMKKFDKLESIIEKQNRILVLWALNTGLSYSIKKDTIEQFLFDLLMKTDQPIVLLGAMCILLSLNAPRGPYKLSKYSNNVCEKLQRLAKNIACIEMNDKVNMFDFQLGFCAQMLVNKLNTTAPGISTPYQKYNYTIQNYHNCSCIINEKGAWVGNFYYISLIFFHYLQPPASDVYFYEVTLISGNIGQQRGVQHCDESLWKTIKETHYLKVGDVIGYAIDVTNKHVQLYLNGNAVNEYSFKNDEPYYPMMVLSANQICHFNFGEVPFRFPPSFEFKTFPQNEIIFETDDSKLNKKNGESSVVAKNNETSEPEIKSSEEALIEHKMENSNCSVS